MCSTEYKIIVDMTNMNDITNRITNQIIVINKDLWDNNDSKIEYCKEVSKTIFSILKEAKDAGRI